MIDPRQLGWSRASAQMTAPDPLNPGLFQGIDPALLQGVVPAAPQGNGGMSVSGRPLYNDPSGGVYSEKTVTFPLGNKWVTFPSVDAKGNIMSEDQVADYVRQNGPVDPITGEQFPTFNSQQEAVSYAKQRSSSRLPAQRGAPAPQPGMGFTHAPQGGGFGDFLGGGIASGLGSLFERIMGGQPGMNQTYAWLTQERGVDPGMARLMVRDPGMMRGYIANASKGTQPIEINGQLVNPQTGQVMGDYRNPPTTDDIREYNFAVRQGYDGSFTDYQLEQRKAGATNVTVGGGKYGTIPPGFELVEGPDGASMRAIPGGPAAMEAEQAAEQESLRKQQKTTATGVVTEDIGRAIDLIDKGGIRFPVTGFGANWASAIGGSEAADLKNLLDTVKANVGFDKLQAMREASPTGGALGQVSERENVLLQSVLGALEQSQSPEQLKYNLNRLNETILEIVHGPQWRDVVARQRLGGALEGGGNMGGAELNSWVADPGASIGGGGGVVDWQTYFGGM